MWTGLPSADFICHIDIYQRSVTLLCMTSRQQLQTSSSAGGDTDSNELLRFAPGTSPPPLQLLIQLDGSIFCRGERWVWHVYTLYFPMFTLRKGAWWNSYWLSKCLTSEQQQQLVARCWWHDTRHTCESLHGNNSTAWAQGTFREHSKNILKN